MTAAGHVGVSVMSYFYPGASLWAIIASTVLAFAALLVTSSCLIVLSIAMCCNQKVSHVDNYFYYLSWVNDIENVIIPKIENQKSFTVQLTVIAHIGIGW